MRTGSIVGIGGGIVAGLFGLSLFLGSWYTIDQTERGVILRNGKVTGVAEPGLGFKAPIMDSVIEISIQEHKTDFEKMAAYSFDQQAADLRISVNWQPMADKVTEIYSEYKGLDGLANRVVTPAVYQQTKVAFGQFTAAKAIQERARLNAAIADAISAHVAALHAPVIIRSVQLENIDFSDAYEKSIEQRMLAEVAVQKEQQNLSREKVLADIEVTKANGTAQATLAQAKAQAEAIKLRGEAEASAIKVKQEALSQSPNYVSLVQAEKWNGQLPASMIPGSAVPMLSLK